MRIADEYKNAAEKLKMAEFTSDVQTDVEDEPPKKRRRVAPRKLYETDDDEDDECTPALLPRPPKIKSRVQSPNDNANSTDFVTSNSKNKLGSTIISPNSSLSSSSIIMDISDEGINVIF